MTRKETAILETLGSRELYGLDIVRESGGRVGQGTLYVTLHSMEERGLIVSRAGESRDGLPARRLYRRVT